MIKIIKKGYVKPDYKTECQVCKTLFTFNTDDTEFVDVMYNDDEYVDCPVCGHKCYDDDWEPLEEGEEEKLTEPHWA